MNQKYNQPTIHKLKNPSYEVFRQDRALRKCSVNIFSDRARWRGGNIFSVGRRSNPKSQAPDEAAGKVAWVMLTKKLDNFTEKDH